METPTNWRVSIRGLAMITVFAALILWSWTVPVVWEALDIRNFGQTSAIFLFSLFWVGMALVAWRGRTPSGRLVGFGWVFLAELLAPYPMPATQVGHIPDYHACGQIVLFCGAILLFVAGALAGRLEKARTPDDRRREPAPP